jgi:hypothetical protein
MRKQRDKAYRTPVNHPLFGPLFGDGSALHCL